MRRLAALSLVLALVAALAAAMAAAKLSPAEQTWAKKVVTVYNKEAKALDDVQAEEEADGGEALIADSGKANDTLTDTLAVFVNCPAWIKAAGKPPTARLDPADSDFVGSCSHLSTGAQDVAKAIGAIRLQQTSKAHDDLEASVKELSDGSRLLVAAQRELSAVGS
jgi:hypothetical protein